MNNFSNGTNYDEMKINILLVADKCGIEYETKPYSHGRYMAQCPFCESNSKKLSLTVESANGYKNVYRCYKCGASGHSVALYANLKGLNTKEAFKELISDHEVSNNKKIEKLTKASKEIKPCLETADTKTLNSVYSDFIKLLRLNKECYENLKSRRLSDEYIKLKGYKSIPTSFEERYSITNKLLNMGHKLDGIAGFFKDKYDKWTFCGTQGYLIPIRNVQNEIISFQIRMNELRGNLRYTYFTSSKYETGAKALAVPNVSYGKNIDYIYITEGPLKGDVASYLSDDTFVAVPGVSSGIDILINYLKDLNPIKSIICYDMDMYKIPEVKNALNRLIFKLNEANIYCELKLWDNNYKGIDDYYYSIKK